MWLFTLQAPQKPLTSDPSTWLEPLFSTPRRRGPVRALLKQVVTTNYCYPHKQKHVATTTYAQKFDAYL